MTFSVTAPTLIIADHTGVPAARRETSAEATLVEYMVHDARARGIKIVPLCPFVNAQRRKHPGWADAFAT
ncbi:MAG: GNAT family N-acetyltransferase [Pseudotabrizicola sp.]|uniref:GNAT family N-acetyltransferase n=1 Tax=Pseudotabrizicola sp. TaxID=2939647 RepID=UPI00272094F9|nr:GNAT family N-acetyltransferase [Pseudotabrizicola sp.]MDO8884975.1 GNAT family N-acetyltransferase [Pseudotabrizicola sp.]MDP2081649.1 GNAT family N-acetyltransferase [Pseudotabrizicola sp.]MDZ7573999.1 GNAT family N-acetyltransferase [Pseudotabrizicola sp.]